MFPRGSSSSLSNTCNDAEVFEVSPPSFICSAKTRSSKDKEVLYHEIIDVDVEEDSESDDITLTHVIQKTSHKGKVSQFDHMDTPGGRVEATFPSNVLETTSSIRSASKGSKRPTGVQINAGGKKGKISSEHKEYNAGHKKMMASASATYLSLQASQYLFSHASTKQFSHPKNKRTYRPVNSLWSGFLNYYPFGAMSANGGGYPTLNVPTTTFTPQEFPNDGVDQVKNPNCAASSKNVDEVLQKYDNFKRFDIVDDFPDHHFRTENSAKRIFEATGRKIQQEWRILEKDLPGIEWQSLLVNNNTYSHLNNPFPNFILIMKSAGNEAMAVQVMMREDGS